MWENRFLIFSAWWHLSLSSQLKHHLLLEAFVIPHKTELNNSNLCKPFYAFTYFYYNTKSCCIMIDYVHPFPLLDYKLLWVHNDTKKEQLISYCWILVNQLFVLKIGNKEKEVSIYPVCSMNCTSGELYSKWRNFFLFWLINEDRLIEWWYHQYIILNELTSLDTEHPDLLTWSNER